MKKPNFHIATSGEVSGGIQLTLLNELERLSQFLPSDSVMNVDLDRVASAWDVKISVHHSRGHIAVAEHGTDFQNMAKEAVEQLYEKIRLWRDLRNVETFHLDSSAEKDSFHVFESVGQQEQYAGTQVLLVEDDPAASRVLEAMFRKSGCNVESTSDPIQAIREMKEKKFNLIVLDWNLPYLNGCDILKRAEDGKEAGGEIPQSATPVIVCSSLGRDRIDFPQLSHFYEFDYWNKAMPFSKSLQAVLSSLHKLRTEPVLT